MHQDCVCAEHRVEDAGSEKRAHKRTDSHTHTMKCSVLPLNGLHSPSRNFSLKMSGGGSFFNIKKICNSFFFSFHFLTKNHRLPKV